MKKLLTYEQALKMLERGQHVECQLSYRIDDAEIVCTKERLSYLYNLEKNGIQKCIIYAIPQKNKKIPENSIGMSFDETYFMVRSGETVYYINEDGEEEEIKSEKKLLDIRRKTEHKATELLLYWHE